MASNASNSSLTQDGSNSGNNNQPDLVIAIVALVISVIAMFITIFQALQQYFSSATGLESCSPKVMGKWSALTETPRRIFRVEVRFRVPVIFVAPPTNRRGPLGKLPDGAPINQPSPDGKVPAIYYMNGTEESFAETHTWTEDEYNTHQNTLQNETSQEGIRTTDNEMATWLALMMAVQRMEKESQEWQLNKLSLTPEYQHFYHVGKPTKHTLSVGIQEKTRSWDTMPDGFKKPYATSTIGHFVEVMAMLGIHWREFDRNNNSYRAQGNGFSVSGWLEPSLGIVFTFQKVGKTWFKDFRIVPNDKIKELCFGLCPTIFRVKQLFTDESKDKGTLQLGSHAEIADMLTTFGCNTNTVNYFRHSTTATRYAHLFPIAFEMIGMIGEVLQIQGTAFTMLPNPTFFTWDTSSFSLAMLLESFGDELTEASGRHGSPASAQRSTILKELEKVQKAARKLAKEKEEELRKDERNARAKRDQKNATTKSSATAVDNAASSADATNAASSGRDDGKGPTVVGRLVKRVTRFSRTGTDARNASHIESGIADKASVKSNPSGKPSPLSDYIKALHEALKACDEFLHREDIHHAVPYVFCLHIQEVLKYLNMSEADDTTPTESGVSSAATVASVSAAAAGSDSSASPSSIAARQGYVPLHKLDMAHPHERHVMLAQLYVHYIREHIITAHVSLNSLDADVGSDSNEDGSDSGVEHEPSQNKNLDRPTADDIWCTLVFRMICWLMLHNFHKKDIQISKSDVLDSRLPVFIL